MAPPPPLPNNGCAVPGALQNVVKDPSLIRVESDEVGPGAGRRHHPTRCAVWAGARLHPVPPPTPPPPAQCHLLPPSPPIPGVCEPPCPVTWGPRCPCTSTPPPLPPLLHKPHPIPPLTALNYASTPSPTLNHHPTPPHPCRCTQVTYPLHIILRYEIERGLLDGSIPVDDVPKVWNDKMESYLGTRPKTDAEGCLQVRGRRGGGGSHAAVARGGVGAGSRAHNSRWGTGCCRCRRLCRRCCSPTARPGGVGIAQDVHWSAGLLGYFPTYSLGAMYACQIFQCAQRDIPGLEDQIKAGGLGRHLPRRAPGPAPPRSKAGLLPAPPCRIPAASRRCFQSAAPLRPLPQVGEAAGRGGASRRLAPGCRQLQAAEGVA
jgi:hypothetical protein